MIAPSYPTRLSAACCAVASLVLATSLGAQNSSDLDRAIALFEAEQFAQAQPLFERAKKASPKNPEPHYYLGRIMFDREFYDVALDSFEEATDLAPMNSQYRYWHGRARLELAQRASLLTKLSHATKAKRDFEKAIELDQRNVDAHEYLAHYLWNAPGTAGGDKDRAMMKLADVARLDPPRARRIRADFLMEEEKTEEAIQELLTLIDQHPDAATTGDFVTLGILYQQVENFDAALAIFDRAIEQNEEAWTAHYQIGRTAALSGKHLDRGAQALTRYLSQDPPPDPGWQSAARWRLGMIYEHQGELQRALAEYERAVEVDPERKEAKDAARRLRKAIG